MSIDVMSTADPEQALAASAQDAAVTTAPSADEQRYIDALKHITNLQKQLSALRGTIPSILDPALKTARSTQQKARTSAHDEYISTIYDHDHETEDHTTTAAAAAAAAPSRSLRGDANREAGRPRTSAHETYTLLMDAARTSMKDVAALRKEWDSETTQDVLRRARESATLDGDLEAGRGVEGY